MSEMPPTKKPTKGEKEQLLEVLKAKRDSKRANKLRDHVLYPVQRDFVIATGEPDVTEVAFRAGNQQGKTLTCTYTTSVFATGTYPDNWPGRVFSGPSRGWIVGESTTAVRDVAQKYLIGLESGEPGFIPQDRIVKTIMGHGAGGGIDKLLVRHLSGGISEIGFKSYDQDRTKLQGATLDWVLCDEEPPLEHYIECLARLIATRGLMMCSFTPLFGSNRILPRFNERTPEALRHRRMIHGRADDALHLKDPEARSRLFAMFPEHERKARIEGLPLYGSGAVFEDVTWEQIVAPFIYRDGRVIHETFGEFDARGLSWLWAIDFGIAHPFAAVLLAYDAAEDVVYIMAAFKMAGATPPVHASRMRALTRNLGEVRVAWPHDGNAREKGSGETLASIYKREGLAMLPTHATHKSGGYFTEPGIVEMITRFRDGRLKVAPNLVEFRGEFEMYHRKDGIIVKENDDIMSASRVGVMQIRSAKPPAGVYRGVPIIGYDKPRELAQGLDFDLFNPNGD
ncbi:MAG TPA: terminase family protein [Stellaceae bacterium]|nr:terminase family protein [Stellaceae bacterium]